MKKITCGDSLHKLKGLKDASVDAIVTDPPYGFKFMGKRWDYDVPSVELWRECLRVLKPGGHLLAFAGARTYHRMAVNIEDAGFEIRDQMMWIYGSGFPKSLDVSKAVDKHLGAMRPKKEYASKPGMAKSWDTGSGAGKTGTASVTDDPITAKATIVNGWGTALKPAHEPIVVARRPLEGTVAQNVLTHMTGALNIDACLVPLADQPPTSPSSSPAGRWPANIIHDGSPEVLHHFAKYGNVGANSPVLGSEPGTSMKNAYNRRERQAGTFHNDEGTADRFFYCAKASKADRDDGLEEFPMKAAGVYEGRTDGSLGSITQSRNVHPTVKPTTLMMYLVRLVTPAGGTVLDPFAGSGSTGKACELENFGYILIEREKEYIPLIKARLKWAANKAKTRPRRFADFLTWLNTSG